MLRSLKTTPSSPLKHVPARSLPCWNATCSCSCEQNRSLHRCWKRYFQCPQRKYQREPTLRFCETCPSSGQIREVWPWWYAWICRVSGLFTMVFVKRLRFRGSRDVRLQAASFVKWRLWTIKTDYFPSDSVKPISLQLLSVNNFIRSSGWNGFAPTSKFFFQTPYTCLS